MKTLFGKWHIALTIGASLAATALTGCGLMKDEPEDCATAPATSVSVKFKYDYTMAGTNVFSQEVGGVTLYVFDQAGNLLTERSANYANGIAGAGFAMDITDAVIHNPQTYTLYALAVGNHAGYEASLLTPGATFTRSTLQTGISTASAMELTLSRNGGVVPVIPTGNKDTRIDTTWVTLAPQKLVIPEINFNPVPYDEQPEDFHTEVTVPLMRVTNHLECIFWLSDFPSALRKEDFTISVQGARNGNLGITGTPADGSEALTYEATFMWVENAYRCSDGVTRPVVHAIFGLSRLMANGGEQIKVTNALAGGRVTTVPSVNRLLANGREAYPGLNYSEQEYLDREHNYCLEFPIDDVIPKYVNVSIGILSWSKRIQIVNL